MYRDELDALNAIYREQCRTNDLLKNLIAKLGEEGQNAAKGRSRGNPRKGTELPVATVDSKKSDTGKG